MEKEKLYRKLVFYSLIGCLLPAFASIFSLPILFPLQGVEEAEQIDKDTLNWWSGSWQKVKEKSWTRASSAHPVAVKFRNQFEFSIFNKINAQNVYYHDGVFYRFSSPYQNDNVSFKGYEELDQKFAEYKKLYDTLKAHNVSMIFVMTSAKHHQYPQHLPEENLAKNTTKTNYYVIKSHFAKHELPFIDFDTYFLERQKSENYLLTAKTGVHWTRYGAAIALDSVIKTAGKLRGKSYKPLKYMTIPALDYDLLDNDLAIVSNLMFNPPSGKLADIIITNQKSKGKKLKAVVIGDSFFHCIAWTSMRKTVFDKNSPFYYYFNTEYDMAYQPHPVKPNRVKSQILNSECVIFFSSPMNMEDFGFESLEYINKLFE